MASWHSGFMCVKLNTECLRLVCIFSCFPCFVRQNEYFWYSVKIE